MTTLLSFPDFFNPESIIRYGGITLLLVIIFMETGVFFGFFLPGDSLVFVAGLLSDTEYLDTLAKHLPAVFAADPEIVFYLAGADPYKGDKLGRLALSIDGLRERDAYVLRECYEREVPIVTVMSGGYGKDINDTIEIHCNTIRSVKDVFEIQTAARRLA